MKLRIIESEVLGIAVIDVETSEVFESGYETMQEAKEALKNFKEMYC